MLTKATDILAAQVQIALSELYQLNVNPETISFQKTKQEFEGDFTLVVFPYTKVSKKGPEQTAEEIGAYLKIHCKELAAYNVVKGFLNLLMSDDYWQIFFKEILKVESYGTQKAEATSPLVLLEYSSPNTNKPLHLGHVRNHLLGYSVAEILKANGKRVSKTCIVNDRGVHICKSMLAWQKFGNGETPESSALKGDHLVGKYYVAFDKQNKKEIEELVAQGLTKEEAEKKTPMLLEVQDMLRKWEAGDKEIIALWQTMNSWVYAGFDVTYKTLGIDFDSTYYESNTYILGKDIVVEGLEKGVFFKKDDGSVWIDLTADGLDQKIVMRSDGTSVYITQDIGTAVLRYKDNTDVTQMIYTVGNEQDYHFKVLFLILNKLGYTWAKECYHLSYGMVELPEGKMKSREGTVVDADELLQEMYDTAEATTKELGKIDGFSNEEANTLYRTISLGALKYFMLKVDPKKKMLFDPKESIDFNGNTGPFIQYTYARIKSILRKAEFTFDAEVNLTATHLHEKEKALITLMYEFPVVIAEAGKAYSPALVANYVYELSKAFSQFYNVPELNIVREENAEVKKFRLALTYKCSEVIKTAMNLLGVNVPERM
jgi:arginyl-tRNA synthetase